MSASSWFVIGMSSIVSLVILPTFSPLFMTNEIFNKLNLAQLSLFVVNVVVVVFKAVGKHHQSLTLSIF